MSPDRFSTRIRPTLLKPYDRTDSPATFENLLGHDAQDQPGFPTHAQYRAIEASYIDSLSPGRQSKALISQALFDRIWDVLTEPLDCKETAQFRYWVRKMFNLGTLDGVNVDLGCVPGGPPKRALLHDGLLVAVQEKIYSLLCHFHGKASHGGRDKTCFSVRQCYTWIPKDLIAQFVKTCPTCKYKRRGHLLDIAPMARLLRSRPFSNLVFDSGTPSNPSQASLQALPSGSSIKQEEVSVAGSWQYIPPLCDCRMSRFDSGDRHFLGCRCNTAVSPAKDVKASNVSSGLGLQGLPMSREVSLYQGLPNGWQFHSDYVTAHAACLETKKLKLGHLGHQDYFRGRPRIPSIAPMVPPNIQELMNAYLVASQRSLQEEQCPKYVDPALLSLSRQEVPRAAHDGNETASVGAPPKLNPDQANSESGSFHALHNLDTLYVFSPATSQTSSTPDLVESGLCLNGSPLVTELSTPQDEFVGELGGNLLFSGLKPPYNSGLINTASEHE